MKHWVDLSKAKIAYTVYNFEAHHSYHSCLRTNAENIAFKNGFKKLVIAPHRCCGLKSLTLAEIRITPTGGVGRSPPCQSQICPFPLPGTPFPF